MGACFLSLVPKYFDYLLKRILLFFKYKISSPINVSRRKKYFVNTKKMTKNKTRIRIVAEPEDNIEKKKKN